MPKQANRQTNTLPLRLLRILALVLVVVMLIVAGLVVWTWSQGRAFTLSQLGAQNQAFGLAGTDGATATPSATASPPVSQQTSEGPPVPPFVFAPLQQGLIVLAMDEGGYTHLFAYQHGAPFLRLTHGAWHDITPALSPDGARLAFASNRDGFWDLYLLEFTSGDITRLTSTPAYDASPSWSPDGLWLAYESYTQSEEGDHLDIYIISLEDPGSPIQLTDDLAADFAPNWSPQGRQIAFVSTRTGDHDIWLADLDRVQDRFLNISHNRDAQDGQPAWSADGGKLSWSSVAENGVQDIYYWDNARPQDRPIRIGNGQYSAWSPSGESLLTTVNTPNHTYLTAYSLADKGLSMPTIALQGAVQGVSWAAASLPESLPLPLIQRAQMTPTPNWEAEVASGDNLPGARVRLVAIPGIDPPDAKLQDRVDESFHNLRQRVAQEVGWDFLASLEHTFIPLTAPLGPGMNEDWLYTGRAFSFNTASINAGWVLIVREDYGPQTYWRVYLRTRFQDGTQGKPLQALPWDLAARHSGDPVAYEEGGAQDFVVPEGYWLDFTALAKAYGWERMPALHTWRRAASGAQFNKFALTENQDWFSAMLEVYPRAALDTYTPVPSPTDTPTITNTPTKTPTLTRTPWLSRTPTPTRTPWPTRTPTPTRTPRPTRTPTITSTP